MPKHTPAFVDGDLSTANRIVSAWLNDVNTAVFDGLGNGTTAPTTNAGVRVQLTVPIYVATIAALKALTPASDATCAVVKSYYGTTATGSGGGVFYWNSADSRADNGGTIIAANAGGTGRWNRLYKDFLSVMDFGAKGDASTNDTAAIQAAITFACSSVDPNAYGTASPWNGAVSMVYFPTGRYVATAAITIPGSIKLWGPGGGTYSGARIVQTTTGEHLFRLTADTDGSSNSTEFANLILQAGAGASNPNISLITATSGISSNSVYIRNCWFQTPETYAIYMPQGDDLQITNCTFDVSAFGAVKLGADATHKVTNARILGCTFYDIRGKGCIEVVSAKNVNVEGNCAYGGGATSLPYFVDSSGLIATAGHVANINVVGNTVEKYKNFVSLSTSGWNIEGNICTDGAYGDKRGIEIGGGGTVANVLIHGNQLMGTFGTNPVIDGTGTIVNSVTVTGNRIYSSGAATIGLYFPLGGDQLVFNNSIEGFTTKATFTEGGTYTCAWTGSVANPVLGNGTLTANWYCADRLVTVQISLVIGGTTTTGTGDWRFSLPVVPAVMAATGVALANDAGNSYYVCTAQAAVGGTYLTLQYLGASRVTPTVPFAWGNTDTLDITISYLRA